MKYIIFGPGHKKIGTFKCDTLQELACHLDTKYAVENLCCVEDQDGFGYNAEDLITEELAK